MDGRIGSDIMLRTFLAPLTVSVVRSHCAISALKTVRVSPPLFDDGLEGLMTGSPQRDVNYETPAGATPSRYDDGYGFRPAFFSSPAYAHEARRTSPWAA